MMSKERELLQSQKADDAKETVRLRDWFAGLAMQGFITADNKFNLDTQDISDYAYAQANEMLKEREKINETEYQNDIQAAFGGLSQTAAEY